MSTATAGHRLQQPAVAGWLRRTLYVAARSARIRRITHAVLLAGLGLNGCDDAQEPAESSEDRPILSAAIVSNPRGTSGASAGLSLSGSLSSGIVFVSLPPGTVPGGEHATIRNPHTGSVLIVTILDGGFDPAAVDANAGDTLDLDIRIAGSDAPQPYAIVVPGRRPPIIVRTDPPPKKRDVPLNASLLVVFSEPIDTATLTDSSVRLILAGTAVEGTLTLADSAHLTVTFTPAQPLVADADYALLVTRAIEDLDGDALDAAVTVPFRSAAGISDAPWSPLVSNPSGGGGGIAYVSFPPWSSSGIQVVARNRRTAEQVGAVMVDGGFDPMAVAARVGDTLDLRIDLPLSTGGGAIRFVTVVPSRRPPMVVRTEPAPGRRDVTSDAVPLMVFSEPLNGATLTAAAVQLSQGWVPVAGTLAFGDSAHLTVTFTPAELLAAGAEYALLVTQAIEDLDGDTPQAPTTAGFATLGPPPPPSTQLAFVRDGQIHLVNSDGTGLVRLSDGPNDRDPAWSPDGRRIAFTSARGAEWDSTSIYIMDADGANLVRRTTGGYASTPNWSPDGAWIVFSKKMPGSLDIHVMKADDDGTPSVDLTNQQGWEDYPAWSPDGTRIAFVSDVMAYDFTSDVFITTPVGGVEWKEWTQLTSGFGFSGPVIQYYQPAWSPDGQRLAVVTCPLAFETCGSGAVAVMNADGSGLVQLAATIGFARPTWSSDGQTIAFGSSGSIYWVSADGSTRGLIVADGDSPAWRPSSTAQSAR